MKKYLLVFLMLFAFQIVYSQSADEYYNKGLEECNKDTPNYEKAKEYFSNAIKLNPNSSEAFFYRGYIKRKLSQYEEAITDFSKAIELDPKFYDAYNKRGNSKTDLGLYKEAITDYNKEIDLNPSILSPKNYKENAVKKINFENKTQKDNENNKKELEESSKANDNVALINYSSKGDIKKVTTLLKKGADPNYKLTEDGSTAIIVSQNVKITQLLFQYNANINAQDNNGITALMWASANGRNDIVEFLISNGADPTQEDKIGNTADKYAERKNYNQIANLIRQKIEIKNDENKKQNYYKFLSEADTKFRANDFVGSLELYTKAIQSTSKENIRPYVYRAYSKVFAGYNKSAIEDCSHILNSPNIDNSHMNAYYIRALGILYSSDYFKVLNEYNSNPDFKRSDGALLGLSDIERARNMDGEETRSEKILRQKNEYRKLISKTKGTFQDSGACEDFVKAIELGNKDAVKDYNQYCK